jgi:hypothetical protein
MPAVGDHLRLEELEAQAGWSAAHLHLRAIAWCADVARNGGYVPEYMPPQWGPPRNAHAEELVQRLLSLALWVPSGDGYQIVDFDSWTLDGHYEEFVKRMRSSAGRAGGLATQNGKRQEVLPVDPGGRRRSKSGANGKQTKPAETSGRRPFPPDPPSQAAAADQNPAALASAAASKDCSVGV